MAASAASKQRKKSSLFVKSGMGTLLEFQVLNYPFLDHSENHCTKVRFAGGFITAIVVNPLERKLAKRTSVQWCKLISIMLLVSHLTTKFFQIASARTEMTFLLQVLPEIAILPFQLSI